MKTLDLTKLELYDPQEHGEDGDAVTVWIKLPKGQSVIEGVYALSIAGGIKAAWAHQQVATYGAAYRAEREEYDVWAMRFSTVGVN